MDKLELKDIAPYLPYRLKLYHLSHFKGNKIIEDWGLKNCSDYPVSEYCDGITYGRTLQEIKLLLRPMSDLTKEITHNGETFVPADILFGGLRPHEARERHIQDLTKHPMLMPYCYVRELYKMHFDVNDLIGRGLAINLNEVDNGK
ncbi:hypothetical protein HZP42_19675 [Elizabethkingia anophelis]|nr:hypothetical protein [Elizabethkingia anophelis]MCT4238601.1 hypothetical protein [Elizabethkingia anophelis]